MIAPGPRKLPTVTTSLSVDLSTSPSLLLVVTEPNVSSSSADITVLK